MAEQHSPDAATRLQGFEDFVDAIMQEWRAPGVAVTIIKDDEVILARGFGLRDRERELPVTPQTLFPIASCTKAFTTASLSVLADRGELDWDTPVREYLPRFRLRDPLASERITPRDLVSHRSGLPRHDLVWYNNTSATRAELVGRLQYLEPTKDFRSYWQYQNMMYMVAGYLVEAITGQTWEEFVRQHIFRPLAMTRSNFDIVATAREGDDYSHPHIESRDEIREIPFYAAQGAVAPCGAIVSNITEMSNWVRMHLNRGKFNDIQVISPSQIELLHAPQMVISQSSQYEEMPYSSYALGWAVEPYRGHPMIAHSGGIDGFRSLTTLFPRERIGVVVLSNLGHLNVPEILTFNAFERLAGLDETPWSERFMKEHREVKAAEQRGKEQSASLRVEGTQPSHPLKDYAGDYEHPGYGIFRISLNSGELRGTFNEMVFPLKHYHYDIFEAALERYSSDELEIKVAFQGNVKGDIDTLSVPFEPTAADIVFKRVPPREMRERAFLERFVGEYKLLDMSVIVSLKGEHALSIAIPDEPEYELEPYKGLEFVVGGRSGVGLEFQLDETGAVTGALIMLPYGTFSVTKSSAS